MPVSNYRYRFAKSLVRKVAFATFTLALLTGFAARSLAQNSDKPNRKVTSKVMPVYPQALKSLRIEGVVRLKVSVLANGTVANVEIIGGNPILAENAVKAAKYWKYAVAPAQTEEEVVLTFSLH